MGWERGGSLRREGTYVYLCRIHAAVWQKPIQYCKAIILQLKLNLKKKFKKQYMNIYLNFSALTRMLWDI